MPDCLLKEALTEFCEGNLNLLNNIESEYEVNAIITGQEPAFA